MEEMDLPEIEVLRAAYTLVVDLTHNCCRKMKGEYNMQRRKQSF